MKTQLVRFGLSLLASLTLLVLSVQAAPIDRPPFAPQYDAAPPAQPVKLIFIHHSTGQAWLEDGNGELGIALRNSNYFVSDTNYGWGPTDQSKGDTIGDHTDIPDWYSWFTSPYHNTYLAALYAESDQHSYYSRLATDPGGPNTIVMFKSCFPNSNLWGEPTDAPAASADNFSDLTVANAKRIYLDMLPYFAAHQEKLFVVIAAPPLREEDTSPENGVNARAFNNWLVDDWLDGYAYANVFVFDYYTTLTTNGGDPDTNDLGATTGNHHRYRNNTIEHITTQGSNYSAYPSGDSHPSSAGHQKAAAEFVPLLNIAYHRWQAAGLAPDLSTSTLQAGTGHVHPGERITFTLTLRNTGTLSASVALTNVVPSGLAYVPNSLHASAGTPSATLAPTLRWNGWVLTTTPVTITYAATVTANLTQAIISTMTLAPAGYAPLMPSTAVIVNGYQTFLPLMFKF